MSMLTLTSNCAAGAIPALGMQEQECWQPSECICPHRHGPTFSECHNLILLISLIRCAPWEEGQTHTREMLKPKPKMVRTASPSCRYEQMKKERRSKCPFVQFSHSCCAISERINLFTFCNMVLKRDQVELLICWPFTARVPFGFTEPVAGWLG